MAGNGRLDLVHQNAIHVETIRKAQRHQKLHTEFSINPRRKCELLHAKRGHSINKNAKCTINLAIYLKYLLELAFSAESSREISELWWSLTYWSHWSISEYILQSYRLPLILLFSLCVHVFSLVSVHILPDKPMAKEPTEVMEENCEFTPALPLMTRENNTLAGGSCDISILRFKTWSVGLLSVAADFIKAFHKAREEPTKKYATPQTESQEIGWLSTALVKKKNKKSVLILFSSTSYIYIYIYK